MKVIVFLLATTALAVSSPIDNHRVQRHIRERHLGHVEHSGIQHASIADSSQSRHWDRSESQSHHESSQMHSSGGSISTVGLVNQGYSGHGVHGTSIDHSSGGAIGTIGLVNQGHSGHLGQGQYVQGVGHYGSNGGVVEQTSIHQVTHGSGGGLAQGGHGSIGVIQSTHGLNSGVHGGSIGSMGYEQGVIGHSGNVGTLIPTIHNQQHVTIGHHLNGGLLNGGITRETSIHQVTHGSHGGLTGTSGSSGAYVTDIDSSVDSQYSHIGGNVGHGQTLHTSVLNSGGLMHGSSGALGQSADLLYTGSQTHGTAVQHSSHSESHSAQSASQLSGHRESIVSTGVIGSSHGGVGSTSFKEIRGHGQGYGY